MIYNYEMHVFTRDNYEKFGSQFPENSYFYKDKQELIKDMIDLLNNDMSGIYITEIKDNKF